MTRPLSRVGALLALAASAALFSACATTAPPTAGSTDTPAPTATAPEAEPTTVATDEPDASADPTCETILSADTVAEYESVGWSPLSDVFRIGATEIPGGVMCKWGDPEVPSDHVPQFGWAPIDAATAEPAQEDLVADGWRAEQTPEGLIITESAATAIAPDAEGYGWTYLFGDGWVTFADTKQSLVLIEWPQD